MQRYYRKHPPISHLLEGRFGWKIPSEASKDLMAQKSELMKTISSVQGGMVTMA